MSSPKGKAKSNSSKRSSASTSTPVGKTSGGPKVSSNSTKSSSGSSKSSNGTKMSSTKSTAVPKSSVDTTKSPTSGTSKSSKSQKSTANTTSSNKPTSASSGRSNASSNSVDSVGIAVSNALKSSLPEADLRFRLMPEGSGTNMNVYEHAVFDCLVFVIVCERHQTLALTNTNGSRPFSWFPFVTLADVFTWNRISRDGLATMLGKNETKDEMEPTMSLLPDYNLSWLNIFRLQIPKTNKFYLRITQFIKLVADKEVVCCQENNRLRWVKLNQVVYRSSPVLDTIWGDEVVSMCRGLFEEERAFLTEFDQSACVPNWEGTYEGILLQQLKWSQEKVYELLHDFVAHMYPAFTMTINSFRSFMLKYGLLPKTDVRIPRLFRTFADGKESIIFMQLLYGLAAMDPKATLDADYRVKFLFQYYDPNGTGILTQAQICELLSDIKPKLARQDLDCVASSLLSFYEFEGGLDLPQFADALRRPNGIENAEQLLRLEMSYFEAKRSKLEKSNSNNNSSEQSSMDGGGNKTTAAATAAHPKSSGKAKSKSNEALCSNHADKKYDYGLHAVTLNSTGWCVDPRIISENWIKQWADTEMSRHRYSVENVFRVNSVINIFLDLVKDFRKHQLDEPDCRGLLTNEDDWETLYLYLEMLVHQVIAILRTEPKILRLSGPIYVFGDLLGSLRDLFQLESHLFSGSAVVPHTLLFLGNYTGTVFSHGFECILYLFALKIYCPNKVYLLRGRNEMRAFNKGHFREELRDKYGADFGEKFYELMNKVFDCLPVAAVIEESILATHSGIPKMKTDKKLINTMETMYGSAKFVELSNPKESLPIAYEMMVNIPVKYADKSEVDVDDTKRTDFVASKTGDHLFFNRKAFDAFMSANHFDFLIRSHNPCEEGYALCFANRCITVFSCRKMNSNSKRTLANICVVALSDSKRKIRFVRFNPNDGERCTSTANKPSRRP